MLVLGRLDCPIQGRDGSGACGQEHLSFPQWIGFQVDLKRCSHEN